MKSILLVSARDACVGDQNYLSTKQYNKIAFPLSIADVCWPSKSTSGCRSKLSVFCDVQHGEIPLWSNQCVLLKAKSSIFDNYTFVKLHAAISDIVVFSELDRFLSIIFPKGLQNCFKIVIVNIFVYFLIFVIEIFGFNYKFLISVTKRLIKKNILFNKVSVLWAKHKFNLGWLNMTNCNGAVNTI